MESLNDIQDHLDHLVVDRLYNIHTYALDNIDEYQIHRIKVLLKGPDIFES